MSTWEGAWELDFPATTSDELLLAMVVKDLLHGSSFDVELPDSEAVLAVDLCSGDELDEQTYRLLITAEIEGPEDHDLAHKFMEALLEETLEEAEGLIAERKALGERDLDELVLRQVSEDDERWDLVTADWLAPDGAEVPFGFRPFDAETLEPWPDNVMVDQHGRVVLVPFAGRAYVFGIPAPASPEVHET